ncbi:hypothetical protein QA995_14915 [Streptomyces scabiei]|uniref:hypothetical protein n=1 Tax=Streptomyces scabiei TaxID=1930 RepID=UPI002FF29B54
MTQPALRDRIAAALYERERPPRDPHWPDAYAADREVFEAMADAVLPALSEPADRAAVLNAAAQHLYTALFPAVYDDMGQKAAEGVNRAVSELRRMADEQPAASSAEQFAYPRDPDAEKILNTLPPEAQRRIRVQLAAEARQDGAQTSEVTVYLATPCDACQHTLNWHRNDVGCTVPNCVCGRFHPRANEWPS